MDDIMCCVLLNQESVKDTPMNPLDRIYLYTDGIFDADCDHTVFNDESSIIDLFLKESKLEISETVNLVCKKLLNNCAHFDDVTLMGIEV